MRMDPEIKSLLLGTAAGMVLWVGTGALIAHFAFASQPQASCQPLAAAATPANRVSPAGPVIR